MDNYLQEQSFRDVIDNTFDLYRSCFVPIFLVGGVPVAVFQILRDWGTSSHSAVLSVIGGLGSFLVGIVVQGAVALVVSEYVVGRSPDPKRALRDAAGPLFGTLFLTAILFGIAVGVGFVLLVIPGLIFAAWYGLCMPIAAIERLRGSAAMERSKALGAGFYSRNLGIAIVVALIVFVVSAALGAVAALIGVIPVIGRALMLLGVGLVVAAASPLTGIAGVLIYYDMRVRKEAFDLVALAERLSQAEV